MGQMKLVDANETNVVRPGKTDENLYTQMK
jgi:hypothetical protein